MASRRAAPGGSTVRILFLSRDPVVHERSGSTTYIQGLLRLLQQGGAEITVLATTAASRSPRLFFKVVSPLPAGVALRAPGYLRFGRWYLRPWRAGPWARAVSRLASRHAWLRGSAGWLQRRFGARLYPGAWDLTLPTPAEVELATAAAEAAGATVVVANYCLWGVPMADGRFGDRRTAILMHDLLSARVRRFEASGTPLDMPHLSEAEELSWLAGAQTVLAAQETEAAFVRERIPSRVLVTPLVLAPRALPPALQQAGRCLFVGSNIPPNRDALAFLLEAVWPQVRAAVPGATLAVVGTVGRALGEAGRAHRSASLGVEVLGMVPDLETEYARAAVCLVPLRLGTGIKIKLVEALGYGKAIVSTTVGVEGLGAWAAEAVRIADGAESFAAAAIALLGDVDRQQALGAHALRLATLQFGPERPLDPAFRDALL